MSPTKQSVTETAGPKERRSRPRYPVCLDLRYKLSQNRMIVKEGSGRTRDFSESGVFFETLRPAGALPSGLDVELSLDWPARIGGEVVVTVTILGRIVRYCADGIAVKISRCDVRANSEPTNRP